MCGIIVYVGAHRRLIQLLLESLHRLEYRGYDSSGLAITNAHSGDVAVVKSVGTVDQLEAKVYKDIARLEAICPTVGCGHTRWPTSGAVTEANAQPLLSNDKRWCAVLNGIIENKDELTEELTGLGYHFESDNDGEIIPILMEHYGKQHPGDTLSAFVCMLSKLQGAYAVCVLHAGEEAAYTARLGSPLTLGIGKGTERFLSSDPIAFCRHTDEVVHLDDREVCVLGGPAGHQIYRLRPQFEPGPALVACSSQGRNVTIPVDLADVEKGSFPHFMLKEIYSQPRCIAQTFGGKIADLDGIHIPRPDPLTGVVFLACGTSYHASLVGRYVIEEHAHVRVVPEYASEYIYKPCLLGGGDLVVAVSQSGETADTREALAVARRSGAPVAAIVNVVGSQIARLAGQGMYLHAGPEIGVASTKTFTCQVVAMLLLAGFLAKNKGTFRAELVKTLPQVPAAMEALLHDETMHATIDRIVADYKGARSALFLGRGIDFPVALEGALKLKEIGCIHAEGYPAGEMKHGPIALVDGDMPVFVVLGRDPVLVPKVLNSIGEIHGRGGQIVTITDLAEPLPPILRRLSRHTIVVPHLGSALSPLLKVIPLQLIAYRVAISKGLNPDRPRNLAKSVTVE